MFTFDILLASYGRPRLLKKCLESINQNKSEHLSNIFVLTRREDTETSQVVQEMNAKLNVNLIEVENKLSPGASRNILVGNAKSDYVFFLDDDAAIGKNYFEKITDFIKTLSPDVIGGPDISNEESTSQIVLGDVLKSFFVMGPTSKRHFSKQDKAYDVDESNLTLCNLWIKRKIFEDQSFKFMERLNRCEENLFLEELKQAGYKLYFSPAIPVYHHRRSSIKKLALIQFQSGYYRGIVFHINRGTRKSFFIFPLLTGIYLILMPIMPENFSFTLILLHSFLSWIIALEVLGHTKKIRFFILAWMYIVTIHLFFSIGLVFGTVKGFFLNYEKL